MRWKRKEKKKQKKCDFESFNIPTQVEDDNPDCCQNAHTIKDRKVVGDFDHSMLFVEFLHEEKKEFKKKCFDRVMIV